MTCRFLENMSLQTLVAPISEEEFKAQYWEQKPLVLHRNDPNYYGDLFTLEDFDQAIMRSPKYVKMANAATKKNASYATVTQGLEAVLADMRDGGTIVLDQMHKADPKLGLLCRVLAPDFGHQFQTNLYLTPPHGKGFTPHWDNHDVFILQVMGNKSWQIEKVRRVMPDKGQPMGAEGRELRGDVDQFVLEQGDLIYIPRGFVHAAECGSSPSLHITYGVTATFIDEFLYAAIKASMRRNPELCSTLPVGFMRASSADIVNRVVSALNGICADTAFLNEVVDQYRDVLVKRHGLDVSGQVVDFFQPVPLTLEDHVGPRPGSVYRTTYVNDDAVRVNFGARSITFPGFFREGLDFALNQPGYAVRDIPGDLEDEERVVFVERLIQEGLVIRKKAADARA